MTNILKTDRNNRRNSIREMLRKSYTQMDIANELNLSQGTISNEIKSMFREASIWFGDLAKESFIYEYHETIAALDQSMKDSHIQIEKLEKRTERLREMNDELFKAGGDVKTVGTDAQIMSNFITIESNFHTSRQNYVKLIDDAKKKRGELLHKGPMMYAIELALKGNPGEKKIPTPQLDILKGTDQLNNTDEE